MSDAFRFANQLSIFTVACGIILGPAGVTSAQFGRRTTTRPPAASSGSRDSEINRELADIYRRNGRQPPGDDGYGDEDDSRSASSRSARAEVPSKVSQPKPGFFGRLFGKGRDSSEEDGPPPEPRRRLFGSQSQRDSEANAASGKKVDPKTGKKKNSELIDPKDLEPLPPRSFDATGRRVPLSAPKSSREGSSRREPVGLKPPERLPEIDEPPPARDGVVPPEPDDPDGFFREGASAADDDSRDLSLGGSSGRGRFEENHVPARLPAASPAIEEDESLADVLSDADDEVLESPVDDDAPKVAPPDSEFASNEPAEEPTEEGNFESAFDSPYTGATISTREAESQRVEASDTPASRITARPISRVPTETPLAAPSIPVPSPRGPAKEQRSVLKPASTQSRVAEIATSASKASPSAKPAQAPGESAEPSTGLMGYCPVALKETREMVRSRPEFSSQFGGRKYEFASADAKQAFDANPRRFIPAMSGQDVVRMSQGERGVEGSLEHAAWFRGKLYLFSSDETLQVFVNSPSDFVSFP